MKRSAEDSLNNGRIRDRNNDLAFLNNISRPSLDGAAKRSCTCMYLREVLLHKEGATSFKVVQDCFKRCTRMDPG